MNAWLTEQGIDPRDIAEKFAASPTPQVAALWTEHMTYAGSDKGFAAWMAFVDRRVRRIVGLSVYDLPDFAWRDQYDADSSPKEAVAAFAASEPF